MVTKQEAMEAFEKFEPEVIWMSNEEIEEEKSRTLTQNAAFHAMLTEIAMECQVKGITSEKFEKRMFKDGVPMTPGMMKEYSKRVSGIMFNEDKTHKLNREQLSELALAIRDAVRSAFDIYVEFGDEPPMMNSMVNSEGSK